MRVNNTLQLYGLQQPSTNCKSPQYGFKRKILTAALCAAAEHQNACLIRSLLVIICRVSIECAVRLTHIALAV
jgi:hypothetical protein